MPRDSTNIEGYVPLVAGTEVVRRSGGLGHFDSFGLLCCVPSGPPPLTYFYQDDFNSEGTQNMLSHVADIYSAVTDGMYDVSNSTMFCSDGYVHSTTPAVAQSREQNRPEVDNGVWRYGIQSPDNGVPGQFRLTIYGDGYPYGGFGSVATIRVQWDGNGTMVTTFATETGEVNAFYSYSPNEEFVGTITFDRPAASADMELNGATASTSIPSSGLLSFSFMVDDCKMDFIQAENTTGAP